MVNLNLTNETVAQIGEPAIEQRVRTMDRVTIAPTLVAGGPGAPTPNSTDLRSQDPRAQGPNNLRQWLTRELHDGVTQDLWYLQGQLSFLVDEMPADPVDLRTHLEELSQVAQNAFQELQETLRFLKSSGSLFVDFGAEMMSLVRKFEDTCDMAIDYRTDPLGIEILLPSQVAHHSQLLVKEALWNVRRHSMTRKAGVTVRKSRRGLFIIVSDDGCGFDLNNQTFEGCHGLESMRERAGLIGARFHLSSRLGGGTKVILEIPAQDSMEFSQE